MKETEKVQMHINIAGERISLNVGFDAQDDVRAAEDSVCKLYNTWKKQFPLRTDRELLAMISYQYAYYYLTLEKRFGEASRHMEVLDERLDALLGETDSE